MNRNFSLASDQSPDVVLRAIQSADQENLRSWKNASRFSFFYQELITPDSQHEWFKAYLNRPNDFMFIVMAAGNDIGCVGFRQREMKWDVYNVILGVPESSGKGYMSQALRLMCSDAQALQPWPITAKVLTTNPALRWYFRNGFRERAAHADHAEIELDATRFTPCALIELP